MEKALKLTKNHAPLFTFLTLYVIFSFLTYKSVPIANGENFRYLRGEETIDHLAEGKFKEKLLQPVPHYFIYNGYTAVQNLLNPLKYYEWFHLQNLLFASLIFVAVYLFVYEQLKSSMYSLFALIALVLFPTFFGQLGFNPIDMPYTVFFLLSLLAIYYFSKKDYGKLEIITLGILFGISQSLRQLGFTLYIILFLYELFFIGKAYAKSRIADYLLIFLVAGFVMLVTWPNFAVNYFKGMSWHLFVGSNFYLWDYGLLFMDKFLENYERPAYYLPLLQLITSPIYISALVLSTVVYFKKLIKNRVYFLTFVSLALSYLLYFILNPVLYDGTRHFFFMVPLAVILGVINLHEFLTTSKSKTKNTVLFLIFIELAFLLSHTFKTFPYQYVYFNKLAHTFGEPNYVFESDYSSTKYKEATEWLRSNIDEVQKTFNHEKLLFIYTCDNGFAVNYFSHKVFDMTIKREEADIIICDHKTLLRNDYGGELLHSVDLNGVSYVHIFKMR